MGIGIGEKRTAPLLTEFAKDKAGQKPLSYTAWSIARLPLLLALLFLLREPVAAVLTNLNIGLDPARFTHRAIDLIGTPVSRALLVLAFAGATCAICLTVLRLAPARAYMLSLAGVISLGAMTLIWGATSLVYLVPFVILAVTNLLPDRLFGRLAGTPARGDRFMALAVGAAEALMLRRYLEWVARLAFRRPISLGEGLLSTLPSALLLGLAMGLLIKSTSLIPLEQALRMPAEARIVAANNFNWIEMDPTGRNLLASGHGVTHLARYDLDDLNGPPFTSPVDNGGAQGFAYDPAAAEVYVLNTKSRELLVLDAGTLGLKRSLPAPDLSDGDSWVSVNPATNTLTLASEADSETGVPFLVIDRTTGAVRDRRDFDPGNILQRPGSPNLYLSFFRRRNSIMIYDLAALTVKAEATAPSQVDRMMYDAERNQVLLAVPLESRIARFDADTLKPAGEIATLFGARVMAHDANRQLLFVGSLVTGQVAILDFPSGTELARYYLGPWLRTIQADPARGKAYIASNGALYELNYGHLR